MTFKLVEELFACLYDAMLREVFKWEHKNQIASGVCFFSLKDS